MKRVLLRLEFADWDPESGEQPKTFCGVDITLLGQEVGMSDEEFWGRVLWPVWMVGKKRLLEQRPDFIKQTETTE